MTPSVESAGPFSKEDLSYAYLSDHMNAKMEDMEKKHADDDGRSVETHPRATMQIDAYISECRNLYGTHLINRKTRDEYEKMWAELRAERNVDYMKQNVRYLSEAIADAKSYEQRFKVQLEHAADQKWIGQKTRDNWIKRFENPNVLEWDRKKWITDEFPKYREGWKEAANVRRDVWNLAKKLNLKENKVPELKGVLKIQEFLALPFAERKNKIYAAKAALLSHEKKQQGFYGFLKGDIKAAVENGALHSSKAGQWLKRVMESEDPQRFRLEVLIPFIKNWEKARGEFDLLTGNMRKNSIPRGLRVLSADAFLQLNYEQRLSYLHEVRLRSKEKPETDSRLDGFKKHIRHNLDTKDWEGAETGLRVARQFYRDNEDLDSMEEFLRTHSTAPVEMHVEAEKPDAQNTAVEMRELLALIPGDLQWMYVQAMRDGPAVFNRLMQIVYNRVWVYEHRYGNEQLDREHAESEFNKEKTREYMEDGHSRKFERNILDGDTAHASAIRNECVKPQVLYMGDEGRDAVLQKVRTNADSEAFGYWTTLVPMNLPYALHRTIVRNYNYKLKKGLRQIDSQGYRFTLNGALDRKGGQGPAISPAQKQAKRSAPASKVLSI